MLRDVGRWFGFEVRVSGPNSRDDLRFVNFLHLHGIEILLDVGANRGQFAQEIFAAGYNGRIISIEPLPAAHKELLKKAKDFGPRWTVGPRVALSDQKGTAQFHITEADTSSSLLVPLDSFIEATPIVRVEQQIEVQTVCLDDLIVDLGFDKFRGFLKLDVQGSESKVLAGATKSLKLLHGALVELSFGNLYAGQSSAVEVQANLINKGFEIWDMWRGYSHPLTYRLNQVDACFFKTRGNVAP